MFRNTGHQQFSLKSVKCVFSAEFLGPKLDWHGERFWWLADRGIHVCWSLLMSSLFLLWWTFFSAFPGEGGITGTRSSKWKTTAGGDSYGTGGSHAEWPSPHCSGELYHSPANCPTQGKCKVTNSVSCAKIIVVILGRKKVCPGTVHLWSSECVFAMQELLQQSASLKVKSLDFECI